MPGQDAEEEEDSVLNTLLAPIPGEEDTTVDIVPKICCRIHCVEARAVKNSSTGELYDYCSELCGLQHILFCEAKQAVNAPLPNRENVRVRRQQVRQMQFFRQLRDSNLYVRRVGLTQPRTVVYV